MRFSIKLLDQGAYGPLFLLSCEKVVNLVNLQSGAGICLSILVVNRVVNCQSLLIQD